MNSQAAVLRWTLQPAASCTHYSLKGHEWGGGGGGGAEGGGGGSTHAPNTAATTALMFDLILPFYSKHSQTH